MNPDGRKSRAARFLCVLPVFPLLVIGADILVPSVEQAKLLGFGWARPAYAIALVSLLSYFCLGFWLRRWMRAWSWAVAYVFSLLLFFFPAWLLALNTQSIPLNHYLQRDEMSALQVQIPVRYFHYSSSSDGTRLVVRKSDYSEALAEYLRTNHLVAP
jgi:hypothetical protein